MSSSKDASPAEAFRASDGDGLSGPLLALWWDGQGDWEQAHAVAQEVESADGA